MKRTSKKLLSLLIALLMVVSLLPVAALAVEDYGLLVNGVAVTSENAEDLSGLPGVTVAEGGWLRYNAGQNTLYAKDATIAPPEPSAMPSDYAGAVRRTSEDKLTVVSEGVNSFTADDGYSAISGLELQIALSQGSELNCFAGGFSSSSGGIYSGAIGAGKYSGSSQTSVDLTISGPGKLNASSVIPSGSSYYLANGINVCGEIVIDNGAVVTATTNADNGGYDGVAVSLCSDYGSLTVTGSDVTANAVSEYGDAYAVYVYGSIDVTGSSFAAAAAAYDDAYGVYADDDAAEFSDCTKVSISAEGEYAYGIYADDDDIVVAGCDDFSSSAYGDYYAYGLYSYYDIALTECEKVSVTAASYDVAYGIYPYYGMLLIDGCPDFTVTADCGENYGYGYAIYAYEGEDDGDLSVVTVKDSVLTVNAYSDDDVYGIYTGYGSVDISGSVIEIEALCGDDVYGGIYGEYGIKLTDCELVDVTTYGECCSYGLYSDYGDIEIDNCRVVVDATCTVRAYGIYSDDYAVSIRASDVTVTADGVDSSYALYAYDGIAITDAELVEPEGGFYGTYVYDADEEIADYVVILGYIGPHEPEPFVPGYWVKVAETDNGVVRASAVAAGEGDEITLTAIPDKGATLYSLVAFDDAGREIELTANEDGTCSFVMPASDVRVRARFIRDLPFEDVEPDDYFYDAVAYLYDNGITKGTSETTFEPEGVCTRAETVTLLWRMMGEPEPASAECPFEDVAPDAYYYKAVLWAVENGVTLGTSETTFEPDLEVLRAMTATFLYRALKLQGKGFEGVWAFELDFADKDSVPEWSYESFCWMVMNGIVQGADGKLLPLEPCTRGQIAAMLYRTLA